MKCAHCSQPLDRNTEEFSEHSSKSYHRACFEIRFEEIQTRKELIDYICKLQNLKQPTGYILKQIKNFEDVHNYSIRGMLTTLRYVHEVEELPVMQGAGIGIIEYFYEKAVAYYTKLYKTKEVNRKIDYDNTEEIVYSRPPKINKKKIIDIGGL